MATLKQEIVSDLIEIENELGSQTFTWQNNNYLCCASMNEFERELDYGGFRTSKVLTVTVRLVDNDNCSVFPNNDYPEPQQIITYDGTQFRIVTTKKHTTGAYIRLIAEDTTRGI